MIKHDIQGIADVVDALEAEIFALTTLDPHDPQIGLLQERLTAAIRDMYRYQPRGV